MDTVEHRLRASKLMLKLQKREPTLHRELSIHLKAIITDLETSYNELEEVASEMVNELAALKEKV